MVPDSPTVIRLVERVADGWVPPEPTWVKKWDPAYHWKPGEYDGGWLELTADPREAARYAGAAEALEAWKSGPGCQCHRWNAYGEPVRPLAGFTVEIQALDVALGRRGPGRAGTAADEGAGEGTATAGGLGETA